MDNIKERVHEMASKPIPEHVKRWEHVFRVLEMYEKPEKERLQDYAVFGTAMKIAFSTNKSHFMLLDDKWLRIYYIPALIEIQHTEGGVAGIRYYGLEPGVMRFGREKSEKTPEGLYDMLKVDLLPDSIDPTESFEDVVTRLPLYGKNWMESGKPINLLTVVAESTDAVDFMDETFKTYLDRSKTDYVEVRDGNMFFRQVDWSPAKSKPS